MMCWNRWCLRRMCTPFHVALISHGTAGVQGPAAAVRPAASFVTAAPDGESSWERDGWSFEHTSSTGVVSQQELALGETLGRFRLASTPNAESMT